MFCINIVMHSIRMVIDGARPNSQAETDHLS